MSVLNLQEFNRAVRKAGERIPRELVGTVLRKIALDGLTKIVKRNPVDTGRSRGGWQVSIDEIPDEVRERIDKQGSATITDGLAVLNTLQGDPFRVVFIANNVEYIEFLEDGSSDQAPEGMVAVTFEELKQIFS